MDIYKSMAIAVYRLYSRWLFGSIATCNMATVSSRVVTRSIVSPRVAMTNNCCLASTEGREIASAGNVP